MITIFLLLFYIFSTRFECNSFDPKKIAEYIRMKVSDFMPLNSEKPDARDPLLHFGPTVEPQTSMPSQTIDATPDAGVKADMQYFDRFFEKYYQKEHWGNEDIQELHHLLSPPEDEVSDERIFPPAKKQMAATKGTGSLGQPEEVSFIEVHHGVHHKRKKRRLRLPDMLGGAAIAAMPMFSGPFKSIAGGALGMTMGPAMKKKGQVPLGFVGEDYPWICRCAPNAKPPPSTDNKCPRSKPDLTEDPEFGCMYAPVDVQIATPPEPKK